MSYIFPSLKTSFIVIVGLLLTLSSCQHTKSDEQFVQQINQSFESGDFAKVENLADSIFQTNTLKDSEKSKIDSLLEIAKRVKLDFKLTEDDVVQRLSKYYDFFDKAQLADWEQSYKLEVKRIDGEKRYFKNAVSNLFRLDSLAMLKKIEVDGLQIDSLDIFCLSHTESVVNQTKTLGETVLPKHLKLTYTLSVNPNEVPEGETIRCWMPFPRDGHERQKNIKLVSTFPETAQAAPTNELQRAVYLESKAVNGKPTIFQVVFEVEVAAQYFDPAKYEAQTYDKTSEIFKKNTEERPPHIVFSNQIKQLANRIVGETTNPRSQVEQIYQWINDSITWASALEYSTIPNIPAYVLETRHGDCGMQTFLFMSLARSLGIPVKWQSGWMLHPGEVNLHDWCEVYYEGVGWVPLDQSFGLQTTDNQQLRNFYVYGIDAYRLIVNDDFAQKLSPEKIYMRSEPFDFQRGEVEWAGGNLYFDKWDWHMGVEYSTNKSN